MKDIADRSDLTPLFARPGESTPHDLFRLGDEEMLPETAYQLVHDEAMLDGNARLNLATFVGTFMDECADKIYTEAFDKNMIDKDEYRATAAIEDRCWKILAELWHAPSPMETIGTSTVGSSEACMLGGLALKRLWQQRQTADGKSTAQPNLVMSAAVQVCWEKFANYWDVEPRYVPITEDHKTLCGHTLAQYVDENTIGVVAVMGVTYTGMYEPVEEIAKALDVIENEKGFNVPIHIDAASGGFITPFLQPKLKWDFKIERVHSISASGHKYGLTCPGLGWVVWRESQYLPQDLIFKVSYLGGEMPTFALNFSRPGAQVLLQYYNFLRLGRAGFTEVQRASHDVARHIARSIAAMGPFELWNDAQDIPVFAWRLKKGHTKNWDLFDLSNQLRESGWLVPAYPMPADLSDVIVQRIVVRNGFSMSLADRFLDQFTTAVTFLDELDGPVPHEHRVTETFHHS